MPRPVLPPGPGRPKGSQNKATVKAKEAIASFVDGNSERIQQWLEEIYEAKGADGALTAFMGFLEFHIPKLARTELANPPGEEFKTQASLKDEDRVILKRYLSQNTKEPT